MELANSIVGLSQLGNEVGFIGKVSDDELGQKYENGLKKEKVKYIFRKKKGGNAYWILSNFNNTRL